MRKVGLSDHHRLPPAATGAGDDAIADASDGSATCADDVSATWAGTSPCSGLASVVASSALVDPGAGDSPAPSMPITDRATKFQKNLSAEKKLAIS